MAKIKVEVTKNTGFTNRVLAHDGATGLLIVDKEGAQEVIDHPRVRQLISDGTLKETTAKVAAEPEDPEAERREAERRASEDRAAKDAKAEEDRLAAEAKAEEERKKAEEAAAKKAAK